jgi:Transposase DDE domain/Transposase domain (DUF772)
VQGRADPQREILDVESVAGHLLPAGGVFAFLAGHRRELFPEEMFGDLFKPGGRPSVPAEVIASVIVLQTLHGFSDAEAVEALTFDLRWKAACGLAVSATAFHPTTLTVWRGRLRRSPRPNRIFDAVRAVVAETGVLAGKTRRALDSTILDDAVATQDTVTQLIAAIRRVARAVPGATEVIAAHDSAYGTGEALATLHEAGHTPIIKPWPLRPAVEGGFTIDAFTVTEPGSDGLDQPGSVTCPNGITRPITPTRNVIFGVACRGCPLRARCTTSTSGRTLRLHPHDATTRAHRTRAADPQFQAVYRRHRPMVERSISWIVARGNRRLRFRGTALNDLWLHHRVAALNLRRLITLGLDHTGTTWALT